MCRLSRRRAPRRGGIDVKKKKNELQDAIGATLSCDDVFFDGQKHVACVCGGDVDVEERRERHREAWGRRLPSAVGWDMDV